MMAPPRPLIRPVSRPFWEALREERILLQHCRACDRFVHYPRSFCPHCEADDLDWREVSGRGRIISFSLANRPVSADFAECAAQMLAIVEMEHGVRMATTLVAAKDVPEVGAPVTAVFDHDSFDDLTLLRFALS
ncbi:Zn-ribbon domain-containing OB-fold protein [Rhizorhabdus wittichii]|uniref:Zn-ribbon domain-containing OB-fold protein n=1 Tax=Rhizorhabdus wittichii TaxID=160791 RepID=UPI0002D2C32B|nr:zinc ribbon domain-containing protein [Rhizorhabdus wittichii]